MVEAKRATSSWLGGRAQPFTILAVALGGTGWWLGESVGFPPPIAGVVLALVVGTGLGAVAGGPGPLRRVLAVLLALIVLAAGFIGGRRASGEAWNDCVARGENVRAALAQFRHERGRYPLQLAELPEEAVCGRRPLRGSILEYERRGLDGYWIGFGDQLAVHEATEAMPFVAHK